MALTVGVETVMASDEVMILITGFNKAMALHMCIEEGENGQGSQLRGDARSKRGCIRSWSNSSCLIFPHTICLLSPLFAGINHMWTVRYVVCE